MGSARRLTSVAGRWSAEHPWTAIAAWIGAVVVLMVAGHLAGTLQLPYGAQNVGPSGRAEQMISRDFPRHAVEDVLFDSLSLRVSDSAYRAAIRDVLSRIQATRRVTQIQSPLDPRFANQISVSRHAALLQFRITGSINHSATRVVPVLAAVRAAAAAHPQVRIAETGDASINQAINDTVLRDLHRAELLSFPITLLVLLVLLVLLIAFGAVVAALLPLGLATAAILAAGGLVAFTSRLSGVADHVHRQPGTHRRAHPGAAGRYRGKTHRRSVPSPRCGTRSSRTRWARWRVSASR